MYYKYKFHPGYFFTMRQTHQMLRRNQQRLLFTVVSGPFGKINIQV